MINRKMFAAAALALATGAVFAQAAPDTSTQAPNATTDQREANQHDRIVNGAHNDSLSWKEKKRLQLEQQRIKQKDRQANKDGVVTTQEQNHLDNMQDRASKDIYKQKHDGQGEMGKPIKQK